MIGRLADVPGSVHAAPFAATRWRLSPQRPNLNAEVAITICQWISTKARRGNSVVMLLTQRSQSSC